MDITSFLCSIWSDNLCTDFITDFGILPIQVWNVDKESTDWINNKKKRQKERRRDMMLAVIQCIHF